MSFACNSLSFTLKQWAQTLSSAKPLLLGYSGGGDSKALFYALLEVDLPCALIAVHINHGWRKESDQEEKEILRECGQLNVPLRTKKLVPHFSVSPKENLRNREDIARKKRLEFFKEVAKEEGAQGVILAHHAKDQAETVLKRVLEGAFFSKVSAMEKKTKIEDLIIYRPLLDFPKQTLLQFLEKKELSYFQDPTNIDPAYLRSRMRQELLPRLETSFGKRVESNLLHLAKQSKSFTSYMTEKTACLETKILSGPFGTLLPSLAEVHPLEREYFLQCWLRKKGLLRRTLLERILFAVEKKQSGVFFPVKHNALYLYRGGLFFLEEPEALQEKTFHIKSLLKETSSALQPTSWEEYFQGKMQFFLPSNGLYTWAKAPLTEEKKIAKKGIPYCIRKHFYGLFSEKGIFYSPFSYQIKRGKMVQCRWELGETFIKISSESASFAIVRNGKR